MTEATFLLTDIEGSTRLWEALPERMPAALARHDALVSGAIKAHLGSVIKTTGDGMLAVFSDAADAVRAALQLQLELLDPTAAIGLALRVRCGLHRGAFVHRDGDYFGSAINRLARITNLAHGGQTLLSQAAVDALGLTLPEAAHLRDLGRVRLRDLTNAERIYQLMHPKLAPSFPPLRSLESTPNNLVQPISSFIGRERELQETMERLAGCRLLTLLGMGGVGKSRLSGQLAADLIDDFSDGVWLIELAGLNDPRLVPHAVAAVIGVKEEPDRGIVESLASYLVDKHVLLLLDNCEHLRQACAELVRVLLQRAPELKVLATSREALQITGEVIYFVPTLSIPEIRHSFDRQTIVRHESVRLFMDRALAVQPSLQLVGANVIAVADICRRLDGIPLAIELAAARARSLSVQAIAERLEDRFKLLGRGDPTALPRQRTLKALIDWSHDLLSEQEKIAFRRLSVFAGGWTLAAAEAVLGEVADLDLLADLVQRSLLIYDYDAERYRMLDTVRQYAHERLSEANEVNDFHARHLEYFVAESERARPELAGPDQAQWLKRLDTERDNFLNAFFWSEQSQTDLLALRLMHALRPYWINRGEPTIGYAWATSVVARRGLAAGDENRCMALFGAGQTAYWMGRYPDAQRWLQECLDVARAIDSSAIVARVLQPLGLTAMANNDFGIANALLEEAVSTAQAVGNPREVAAALNAVCMLHRLQGQHDRAVEVGEHALALFRELDDRETIAIALLNLAMVAVDRGDLEPARSMLREIGDIAVTTESRPLLQGALELAVGLAAAEGEHERAARCFGAAEGSRESAHLRREVADQRFLDAWIERARKAMGNRFAISSSEGRTLTRLNALALVREVARG